MTAWYRALGVSLLLLWLPGCGGGEEETRAEPTESVNTVDSGDSGDSGDSDEAAQAAAETRQVPAFDQPVMIDVASRLGSDRRLRVTGETNLPESTRLQVLVKRELSGVTWRERVTVEDSRFEAGPFGPGSGLPDGGYVVRVDVQEGSVQPPAVRARLGEENEHLRGPLVRSSRHGLGNVASYRQRVLVGNETRRTQDNVQVLEME